VIPDRDSVNKFEAAISPTHGRTLIVGSRVYNNKEDRRKRYADCVGVDMQEGEGADVVLDLELPNAVLTLGSFAHIECMSVLEHVKRPWLMAANLEQMLDPGGSIFVTVPFIWRLHGYPDDYWRMSIGGIKVLFPNVKFERCAYAHRHLCKPEDIPCERLGEDWPYFARTETCAFGHKQ
jgi:hypothetical protein